MSLSVAKGLDGGDTSAEVKRLQEAISKADEDILSLLTQLGYPNKQRDWIWTCDSCKEINVLEQRGGAKVCGFCAGNTPAPEESLPTVKTLSIGAYKAAAPSTPQPPASLAPASHTAVVGGTLPIKISTPAKTVAFGANSWRCDACTTINDDHASECKLCEADRAPPASHGKTNTWRCDACMSTNVVEASECNTCFAEREQTAEAAQPSALPSGWKCEACLSWNDDACVECHVCSADRPLAVSAQATSPQTWTCSACFAKSSTLSQVECPICFADRDDAAVAQPDSAGWRCSACLSQNKRDTAVCAVCFADRESVPSPSVEQGWTCTACFTKNADAQAQECSVCFADREDAVGDATHVDLSVGKRELVDTPEHVDRLLPVPRHPELVKKITMKTKSFNEATAKIAAERLGRMSNIETADLSDVIAGRPTEVGLAVIGILAEALPFSKVRILDVSDNALGERGIRVLSQSLRKLSSNLEILNCKNDGLSSKSMELLVDALGNAARLQSMSFYSNMSGDGGAIALVPLFEKLGRVKDLPFDFMMASCRVLSKGAVELCKGLRHIAHRLRFLDLSDCSMGTAAGAELTEVLKSAVDLKHLNLKDVGLEGAALDSIISAIGSLKKLEFLDFSLGPLGSKRTKQLIDAVQAGCPNLQVLRLSENESEAKGIASLFSSPGFLPNLKELDLQSNSINNEAGKRLAQVLKDRTALERVELGGNDFSTSTAALLLETLGSKLGALDVAED